MKLWLKELNRQQKIYVMRINTLPKLLNVFNWQRSEFKVARDWWTFTAGGLFKTLSNSLPWIVYFWKQNLCSTSCSRMPNTLTLMKFWMVNLVIMKRRLGRAEMIMFWRKLFWISLTGFEWWVLLTINLNLRKYIIKF